MEFSHGFSQSTWQALRLADAERQRQLEQVSRACETLAEARQGENRLTGKEMRGWA